MAAFTLASLASEITTDPQAIGYAGKTDQAVADLLNRTSGTGTASVFRNDIKPAEIVAAIVAADFAALTAVQLAKLQLMLLPGILDATVANTRTIFLGIFSGMTNTINALTSLASRTGSRAEVLWGTGIAITAQQVGQSRNGS